MPPDRKELALGSLEMNCQGRCPASRRVPGPPPVGSGMPGDSDAPTGHGSETQALSWQRGCMPPARTRRWGAATLKEVKVTEGSQGVHTAGSACEEPPSPVRAWEQR